MVRAIATVTRTTISWNHGIEGPTEDAEVTTLRERQKRNLIATMMLSHGTPMLLAGDEFGHSQKGNNNAYAQDNETSWLNWLGITSQGRALREFTRKVIATRKAFPILYRSRFLIGARNEELDVTDVTWLSPAGNEMSSDEWDDCNVRCFGMLLDGRAQESGVKRRGSDATLLLVYNAHFDAVNFMLPSVPDGSSWVGLIDTNQPDAQLPNFAFGHNYVVTGRSLMLFGLAAGDDITRRLLYSIGYISDVTDTPL
jgi:isoamylase